MQLRWGMATSLQPSLTMSGRDRAVAHRKLLVAVALVLMAVAVFAFWAWRSGAEERAIASLPSDQRAELFRRELASFTMLCGQGPRDDELQDQCKEKAKFILVFPECDGACHALAGSHVDQSRR